MPKNHKPIYRQKVTVKVINEQAIPYGNISCSSDTHKLAIAFWDMDDISYTESMYAIYLSRSSKPICWAKLSSGGQAGVIFDKKVALSHALLCGAHGIIIFHNHPSGNVKPSQQDISMTGDFKRACQTLDITLLDHVILAPDFEKYYSFADEGMM